MSNKQNKIEKPKAGGKLNIKQSKLSLFNTEVMEPTDHSQVPGQQELHEVCFYAEGCKNES